MLYLRKKEGFVIIIFLPSQIGWPFLYGVDEVWASYRMWSECMFPFSKRQLNLS